MAYHAPLPVGPEPMYITCPHCRQKVTTYVTTTPTMKTHLIFLLCCIIGLGLGLCCYAPFIYCIKGCQGRTHKCPRCQNYLGTYND